MTELNIRDLIKKIGVSNLCKEMNVRPQHITNFYQQDEIKIKNLLRFCKACNALGFDVKPHQVNNDLKKIYEEYYK